MRFLQQISKMKEKQAKMKSFFILNKALNFKMYVEVESILRDNFQQHRDLHNLVKAIASNINTLILKGKYHNNTSVTEGKTGSNSQPSLIVETISLEQKTSLPEDKSSFLFCAQPISLNVVTICQDQRSNGLSYKKFAGYYDEPLIHPMIETDRGGRLRKKCFMSYYPNVQAVSIKFI